MHPLDRLARLDESLQQSSQVSRTIWKAIKEHVLEFAKIHRTEVSVSFGCECDDNPDQTAPPNGLGYIELCMTFSYIENERQVDQQFFAQFQTKQVLNPYIPDVGRSSNEDPDLCSFFAAIEESKDFKSLISRPDLNFLGAGLP